MVQTANAVHRATFRPQAKKNSSGTDGIQFDIKPSRWAHRMLYHFKHFYQVIPSKTTTAWMRNQWKIPIYSTTVGSRAMDVF